MREIPTHTVNEGEQVTIRDQFFKESDGTFYVLDDIHSAVARVFDLGQDAQEVPTYQEYLVIDDVFYDTPQIDVGWAVDDTGFNFKWTAPGLAWRRGGRDYRLVVDVLVVSDSIAETLAPKTWEYRIRARGVQP